ncbi:MAG TPA: hypothetical protein VEJ36_01785 [Nitrososphaerales archaeon]|nr:hypothetical protein [Nitrososphaerales archaeon]
MRSGSLEVGLVICLILLSGVVQVRTGSVSPEALSAKSPRLHSVPAQANTTSATTPPYNWSFNLTGSWINNNGDIIVISDTTTTFHGQSGDFLYGKYLTDTSCPVIIGHYFIQSIDGMAENVVNSTGGITNGSMQRCTPANTPLVENCSLNQIWGTTFNATVSENSITGEYEGQYWVWNTTSNGSIIPSTCREDYTFSEDFSLTRYSPVSVSNSTAVTQSSSSAEGQQSSQTSKSSTSASTSSSSSSSKGSSTGGTLLIGIAGAGVVIVIALVLSLVFLRKKR